MYFCNKSRGLVHTVPSLFSLYLPYFIVSVARTSGANGYGIKDIPPALEKLFFLMLGKTVSLHRPPLGFPALQLIPSHRKDNIIGPFTRPTS